MTKGLMIVGYGTRKGNLEQVLETQKKRLEARGRKNVYIAYFRVSHPTVPEALAQMAADGVDDVLVAPYYIAEGSLTRKLIPQKLGIQGQEGTADVGGKKVRIRFSAAFAKHPQLTDIVCDKIADMGGCQKDAILLMGHGSREKMQDGTSFNEETLREQADALRARGYTNVVYSFNEFNTPVVKDGLRKLLDTGAETIYCVPLFVAMGLHLGVEIPDQIGIPWYTSEGIIRDGDRFVFVKYARPVEADNRLADIIDADYKAFLAQRSSIGETSSRSHPRRPSRRRGRLLSACPRWRRPRGRPPGTPPSSAAPSRGP